MHRMPPVPPDTPASSGGRDRGFAWGEGTGIVYMGMSPWEGMWRSRHQLMARFARSVPVLYVEPWLPARRLRKHPVAAARMVRSLPVEQPRHVLDKLYVHRPSLGAPVGGTGWLHAFLVERWSRSVRRSMGQIGIRRPVLFVSRPELVDTLGRLGEACSVYHLVDELAGYTAIDEQRARQIWAQEARLLDNVDLTIVTSPTLQKSKSQPGRKVELVENAVDFERFDAIARSKEGEPADLRAIPRPRLGYSGLVGRRLDLTLLLDLARAEPKCSIVLVGRVDPREAERELSALMQMPNVFFLGQKPVADVPMYVKGFDVCLMPYVRNLETIHISPLKFYEYCSMGRPVVATRLPWAERAGDLVSIAENSQGFRRLCAQALQRHEPDAARARREFARENSWDARVAAIESLVSAALSAGRQKSTHA